MFFTRTDVAELNNSVGEMQKKYGTCKSVRMAEAFNNTCDKWDCPIKCYCAQSEKGIHNSVRGIFKSPFSGSRCSAC